MNILGLNIEFKPRQKPTPETPIPVPEKVQEAAVTPPAAPEEEQPTPKADVADTGGYGSGYGGGSYAPIVRMIYNGDTDFGEMGPAIKHIIDHYGMGQRAWQLDLEAETAHTIVKQKGKWKLGTGLDLQCEPQVEVLKLYGITVDPEKSFNKPVEALWKNYAYKSTMADYANRVPLHKIAKRIEKNAAVHGDVLVIHRFGKNECITTQLIDGCHVSTPVGLATVTDVDKLVDNKLGYDWVWTNGNRVRQGVEISDTGEHIAYHVRVGIGFKWERIPARNSKGLLVAYLVYSNEYRLDNTRGIPDIAPNMQSTSQLKEYTNATVGSAVERQSISYFIEHDLGSEGIDPRAQNLAKIIGTGGNLDLPRFVNGEQTANTIAVSTKKNTFNMTPGSKIVAPESNQELHYKEFHDTRFFAECATVGIPPEVASQLYGGSYSASRAATNGWQFMLNIDRADFGDQFYQRVYNLQLLVWVLAGRVKAPGYVDAFYSGNEVVTAAYNFANWLGDPVPQIDELKEVQAARLKLGKDSENVPLSTFQAVAMKLGEGDWSANTKQYAREMEEAESLDIEKVEPKVYGTPPEKEGGEKEKE